MKKYIVLSVNDNIDYLFFVPLTCWAWRKFGWEPIVFYHRMREIINPLEAITSGLEELVLENNGWVEKNPFIVRVDDYRSDTITQLSRLYASCIPDLNDDDYLMTGDIDMIPLSDYWKPNGGITVWGYDLTGYAQYPICYIGMSASKWREVMNIRSSDYNHHIKRDLDTMPQAKDPDFYKYWFVDQDLITERLKPFKPTTINRGQYSNGFARGRVDRGAWTLDHKEYIDAHLFHQMYHKGKEDKFEQTLDLLYKIWPEENFDWFILYTEKFRKLTGHG